MQKKTSYQKSSPSFWNALRTSPERVILQERNDDSLVCSLEDTPFSLLCLDLHHPEKTKDIGLFDAILLSLEEASLENLPLFYELYDPLPLIASFTTELKADLSLLASYGVRIVWVRSRSYEALKKTLTLSLACNHQKKLGLFFLASLEGANESTLSSLETLFIKLVVEKNSFKE